MNFLNKLRLKTRIIVTMSSILLLYLASVIISITFDHNMSVIVSDFYNERFQMVVNAQKVNLSERTISEYILLSLVNSESGRVEEYTSKAREQVSVVLDHLTILSTLSDSQDTRIINAQRVFGELASIRERLFLLLDEGRFEEAEVLYLDQYLDRSINVRQIIVDIREEAERTANEYIELSDQNSARLLLSSIVLGVIMVGLALYIGIWLIQGITNPVNELKKASQDLAEGNLEIEIGYRSHDELGELAECMNQTALSMSDYIHEIQRCLQALGDGEVDYITRDIFKGDFLEIKDAMDKVAGRLKEQRSEAERHRQELKLAYDAANWANQAKTDFLSHMSHDIRTPMNAITGMTKVAMASLGDNKKVMDCLKRIDLSNTHLLGLINDVLDMSKIESGKMTLNYDNANLPQVLENVVNVTQPMIKSRRQNFSIRLHNIKHENLYCDSLRLNQVFINILSNAIKFTPVGGSITVDVEELPAVRNRAARFIIKFSDTGIGMKPEFLLRIFDSFSRERGANIEKTEGSGLGMAICKRIVDMMEGKISVESELGIGTTFTLDLNLMLADTLEEDMHLPELNVMIVDDDEKTCETAAESLLELGMHADWAVSGAEAVDKVSSGKKYDIIIVDWMMPGMDGLQTTRALRDKLGEAIPIVVISAYDWQDIADEAKLVGVTGFIPKPLFKSTLFYALRKILSAAIEDEIGSENGSSVDFSGKRFLLAEDNEINCVVVEELLLPTGAVLDIAQDGSEAVSMFKNSTAGYYDLILMDVQMPLMDGYEATRAIRAMKRADADLPIIAMTANAFAEDVRATLDAGMNCHLPKPIDFNKLIKEIKRLLKG